MAPASAGEKQSVKRCYSLKRNKEFRRTYRAGRSVGSRSMVLIYAAAKQAKAADVNVRIGMSVGKKIGNAVVRNRTKRRLREAVTPFIPSVKQGSRLIFIAKPPILEESFTSIRSTMRYLLKKAELLEQAHGEQGDAQ